MVETVGGHAWEVRYHVYTDRDGRDVPGVSSHCARCRAVRYGRNAFREDGTAVVPDCDLEAARLVMES